MGYGDDGQWLWGSEFPTFFFSLLPEVIKTSALCPKQVNLDFYPHKISSSGTAVSVGPSVVGKQWAIGMGEDACELPVIARLGEGELLAK